MTKYFNPEHQDIPSADMSYLARYAANIVTAISSDANVQEHVIQESRTRSHGKVGTISNGNDKLSQVTVLAVQGNLIRVTAMDVPIGYGYVDAEKASTTTRPARLLVGQCESRNEEYDPNRPLRVELPNYNSDKIVDEIWKSHRSPGRINTIYWLNEDGLAKETAIDFLPERVPDNAFPYSIRHKKEYYKDGLRIISLETPTVSADMEVVAFTLNAIASSVQAAGIPIPRPEA